METVRGSKYRVFSKVVDKQTSEVRLLKSRQYRRAVHSDGIFYGLVRIPKVECERAYKTMVANEQDGFCDAASRRQRNCAVIG